MTPISTRAAAAITGQLPPVFRRWALRYEKRTGTSLRAPEHLWIDARTPMWDEDKIREATARKPRTTDQEDRP